VGRLLVYPSVGWLVGLSGGGQLDRRLVGQSDGNFWLVGWLVSWLVSKLVGWLVI
jgi:hypothetical protein